MQRARLAEIGNLCFSSGIPQRSIGVALVVGTILNLINQGDVLVAGGKLNWLKIALSYVVPYCVATYGAVSVQARSRR